MPRWMISASTSGSMFPPHSTSPHLASGKALAVLHQRGQADAPGTFDHRLLDLQQGQDGLLDVVFSDQQHVFDLLADHGQRHGAG